MMGAAAQGTYKSVEGQISFTFTKARNYVFDVIIPRVTKFSAVAGLILFLIERKTVGFHRRTVRLSIEDMMNWTNASESSVRRARRYLIDEGYLVVLEEGKGLNKTLFRFDVYPVENGVENAVEKPSAEEPADDNIIDLPDPPSSDIFSGDQQSSQEPLQHLLTNVTDHVSGDESEDQPAELQIASEPGDPPVSSQQTEHEKTVSQHREITSDRPSSDEGMRADPLASQIPPARPPENADLTAENQTEEPAKPAKSRVFSQTSPLRRAPEVRDQIKTNTEPLLDGDEARKKTVEFVCCVLRALGVELEQSDYAFVGWSVKNYGIEAVEKQIEVMRQQSLRGIQFTNPVGRLRSGLTNTYEFCQNDQKRWKAKERAERDRQIAEQERKEREVEHEKVRKEQADPEAQARIRQMWIDGGFAPKDS